MLRTKIKTSSFMLILTGILLLLPTISFAYVDLQVGYTFSSQTIDAVDSRGEVDEDGGAAIATNKGFTINWAWYLWEYTALEINYSQSEQRVEDNRVATSSDGSTIFNNIDSIIRTKTEGIGIRQTFAPRKARFIPSLSFGYARFTTSGETKYKFNRSGVDDEITIDRDAEVVNSSYATFSLAIRITRRMRLSLSARSVVPGVEIDKADKNITYTGGLSWVF